MAIRQQKDPARESAPENSKAPVRRRAPSTRRASAGDIAPTTNTQGIETFAIGEAVAAAQESKIVAVKDILAAQPPGDAHALARTLKTIMAGASPEDALVLRRALLKEQGPAAPHFT